MKSASMEFLVLAVRRSGDLGHHELALLDLLVPEENAFDVAVVGEFQGPACAVEIDAPTTDQLLDAIRHVVNDSGPRLLRYVAEVVANGGAVGIGLRSASKGKRDHLNVIVDLARVAIQRIHLHL